MAIAKHERREKMKSAVRNEFNRLMKEKEAQQVEDSRYNALLHVLHVFCLLHSEFGFGKVRLGRLLKAMEKADKGFKSGLCGGVGWTEVLNYLDSIGFVFEIDRKYVEDKLQRRYEQGVRHYGEDAEREQGGCK